MAFATSRWAAVFVLATCSATLAVAADHWIKTDKPQCVIWSDEPARAGENIIWTGGCENGKASGIGKLTWLKGQALYGSFEGRMSGGKFNGPGILRFAKNGGMERLEGVFKNGVIDGAALYKDTKGNIYEGGVKDGKPHGNGYQKIGAEEYVGEFVNGIREGVGLLLTPKLSYLGEFAKGVPAGSGVLEDDADGRYHGQFKNGKPYGAGTYITKSGKLYQGRFVNGKLNGKVLVRKDSKSPAVVQNWKDGKKVK